MEAIKRIFWYQHKPINFDFTSSKENFIVNEQNDIRFTGKGNFLIVHIQKQNLSTWDLIDLIAENCNIPKQNIGYAGLKDKYATTTQYISLPKRFKRDILDFKDNRVKILETFIHNESLRIGSLTGNHFTIKLFDVDNIKAGKLEKIFHKIIKEGIPNYFGYQRFGSTLESISEGKAIIDEDKHVQDKRLKKFFVNAYSSHLFNAWLAERMAIKSEDKQQHPFQLLEGDIFIDIKTLKSFSPKKLSSVTSDFKEKKVTPSGLIAGRQVDRASKQAGELESKFDDISFYNQGHRRAAVIFPFEEKFKYYNKEGFITLEFTLPKSSYATVLLEALANRSLG